MINTLPLEDSVSFCDVLKKLIGVVLKKKKVYLMAGGVHHLAVTLLP